MLEEILPSISLASLDVYKSSTLFLLAPSCSLQIEILVVLHVAYTVSDILKSERGTKRNFAISYLYIDILNFNLYTLITKFKMSNKTSGYLGT